MDDQSTCRVALESLVGYMKKSKETVMSTSQLGIFYVAYPHHKGIINEKSVDTFGSDIGLRWKSNAPQVDEIILHVSTAKKASTSSEREVHKALAQLRTIILAAEPKSTSPIMLNADNLSAVYFQYPHLKGFITKSNVSSQSGILLDLKWKSIGAKNYIVCMNPTSLKETGDDGKIGESYETDVVTAVDDAVRIVKQLRTVSVVALDIEGDLSAEGEISLIQIATELNVDNKQITSVFIFDILVCPDIMTKGGLATFLIQSGIVKVIHDCRNDSLALFHQHRVRLSEVFDTQVAYSMLGVGQDAHLRVGLNAVLKHYAGATNDLKGVVQHSTPDLWTQRPLPEELLSYAAQDVAYLLQAYRAMSNRLNQREQMDDAMKKSDTNVVTGIGTITTSLVTSNVDTDILPMGLLQEADIGTSKYVLFASDGSYQLADEPFFPPPPPEAVETPPHIAVADVGGSSGPDLEDLKKLISILPQHIREAFYGFPLFACTTEVVLDVGRRPLVRYVQTVNGSSETMPLCSGELHCSDVSKDDLDTVCTRDILGKFSTDNRAGLSSTLHRISRKVNRNNETIGLTMRIGRMVKGSTDMIADIVASDRSVLLLGIPGVGKTTLLREYARVLATNEKRVEIIDTSNEIAGDGDTPHCSVGSARRMMVNKREDQHQVMIEAVQNHTPQCIIVDEIGTKREAAAAGDIAQRGVQIIATAHGTKLKDLLQSTQLSGLLGGVHTVVLGDEEARRRGLRSKSARERLDLPVFDTIVELRSHHKWVVYHDVVEAVDTILEGKTNPIFEVRSQNVVTGDIQVTKTNSFDE